MAVDGVLAFGAWRALADCRLNRPLLETKVMC
jgi:hypothetical protein